MSLPKGADAAAAYRMHGTAADANSVPCTHNIPHVSLAGSGSGAGPLAGTPTTLLSGSVSNSSDLCNAGGTPQPKKKNPLMVMARDGPAGGSHHSFDYATAASGGAGGKDSGMLSLTRSGSFLSSPRQQQHPHPLSVHVANDGGGGGGAGSGGGRRKQTSGSPAIPAVATDSTRAGGGGGGGGGGTASDDSMHEKYFKSVENTPLSRRRNHLSSSTNILSVPGSGGGSSSGIVSGSADSSHHLPHNKHSSDSSPQSPHSPHNCGAQTSAAGGATAAAVFRGGGSGPRNEPSGTAAVNATAGASSQKLHADLASLSLSSSGKKSAQSRISPSSTGGGGAAGMSMAQINSLLKAGHRSRPAQATAGEAVEPYLSKPNLERHSKDLEAASRKSTGSGRGHSDSTQRRSKQQQRQQAAYGGPGGGDPDYYGMSVAGDNGNTSPLYSNWDQEMQEHLLPLQHYIIEQAKLSGCYKQGGRGRGGGGGDAGMDSETIDSDSLHSDSGSEHSFSGHEPDNEDSDRSDGRDGGYLTHHYGGLGDYGDARGDADDDDADDDDDDDDDDEGGVSYYNMDKRFTKNDKKDM